MVEKCKNSIFFAKKNERHVCEHQLEKFHAGCRKSGLIEKEANSFIHQAQVAWCKN